MKQDADTPVAQSNTHLHDTIHCLVPDSNHIHWITCNNKHNCSNSKLQYSHCPILTLNLILRSAPSLTELWTSGGTCSELQDRLKTACKLWKTLSDISLPLLWQDDRTLVRVKDRSSHFLWEWGASTSTSRKNWPMRSMQTHAVQQNHWCGLSRRRGEGEWTNARRKWGESEVIWRMRKGSMHV